MTDRFLSAADFHAAIALLHERGISANELHRIFECGNNQPRCWARIGAPRYVALTLAAVLQGIPPWTPPKQRSSKSPSRLFLPIVRQIPLVDDALLHFADLKAR